MNKKIAILLLTLGLLGMAAGCGKEKTGSDQEQVKEEVLTNKDGFVVAVDVENMEDYVKLGEYKNLEVSEAPRQEVTEEILNMNIDYLLLNKFQQEEVTEDRAVQQNDTVNMDYTGYMDGKEFEGGSAENADLIIGSGGFISGFEDGLIGHKKGEEVTLDLTFPENYREKDLQGKAVQFQVKINKISQPPKLTDEWAAANTEYKTAEEFKDAQKKAIQASMDNDYDAQVKSDLFSLVVENSEILDYPEELLKEAKVQAREETDAMYQAQIGITLDQYIEQQGITEEEEEKALTDMAKNALTQNMIVQAVLNAEGIQLEEEDYNEEKEKFAAANGFPDVATMEMYADAETIKNNVLWNIACERIQSTATVKETQAED